MISQYDVKEALKRSDIIGYREEKNEVFEKESGKVLCNLEEYTNHMRKKLHCSFESIYYDCASLMNVLKCTECETVIFSTDDYEEHDTKLKCPTCSDYKTHFDFWTKEDIQSDIRKQNTLDFYDEMNKRDDRIHNRQKKTGLNNWEIWKKEINKGLKKTVYILGVFDYDSNKIRGLHLEKKVWIKEKEDSFGYTLSKGGCKIPLGWTYFYTMYLYSHIKNLKKRFTK